jgi:predicted phosphatase
MTKKDLAELADFWDTHDITEFEDELEEVKEPVFERRKELKIKLKPDEAAEIEKLAKSRGISGIEFRG